MSKRNHANRPAATTRERVPLFENVKGNVLVLCPFCPEPHPIFPDKIAPCGTILKVMAMQTVYPARTTRKTEVVCIRCGKPGGEMVAYGKGYVHTVNCNPDRRLLATPPTYSEWARRVYNMPQYLRGLVQKVMGRPIIEVNEVDDQGRETGRVLGYYFGAKRGRRTDQREHPQTDTRQPVP